MDRVLSSNKNGKTERPNPLSRLKEKLHSAPKPLISALTVVFGAGAGVLNGFLGSGGGIILIFALTLLGEAEDARDVFATAVLSILPMSAVSVYFYWREGAVPITDTLPFLLPAAVGGIFGAWLLCRISPKLLKLLFAALMLWAGIRMIR